MARDQGRFLTNCKELRPPSNSHETLNPANKYVSELRNKAFPVET